MADSNTITSVKEYFDRHNGLQRTNRYSVAFTGLPSGLPTTPPEDFKAKSVSMAARAIDSVSDNLAGYGAGRAVPRSQRFIPGVLLTFAVTNDSHILEFYNAWFNKIYSGGRIRGSLAVPFQLDFYNNIVYNCQMKVNLLNPNGGINKVFTFYEVYPIENIPMEVSMLEVNKFMTYQVLMNYREFTFTNA